MQDHLLLVVEPEFSVPDKGQLVEDDDRPHDEDDGCGELKYDEPRPNREASDVYRALQHVDGLKTGEEEGRIASGRKTRQDANSQEDGCESQPSSSYHFDRFLDEGAEVRQQQFHEQEGQDGCRAGQEDGFTEELADQLTSPSSGYFAQTDLPRPGDCARGREVREIDAGDAQQEERRGRKGV